MTFKKDCVLDVAFANIEGATFSFVAANERNRGRSYPLTSDGAPEIVVEVESDESTPVSRRFKVVYEPGAIDVHPKLSLVRV